MPEMSRQELDDLFAYDRAETARRKWPWLYSLLINRKIITIIYW